MTSSSASADQQGSESTTFLSSSFLQAFRITYCFLLLLSNESPNFDRKTVPFQSIPPNPPLNPKQCVPFQPQLFISTWWLFKSGYQYVCTSSYPFPFSSYLFPVILSLCSCNDTARGLFFSLLILTYLPCCCYSITKLKDSLSGFSWMPDFSFN